MLYIVLIVSLIAMGAIGFLTYINYRKADVAERPKVLAIGGAALMLLSVILKSLV